MVKPKKRGRRCLPPDLVRDRRVEILFTEDEAFDVARTASEIGESLSAFVRELVLREVAARRR